MVITRLRPDEMPWRTRIGVQGRGQESRHAARINLEQEHKQREETERDSRDEDTQCPHGQNYGPGTV